MKDGQPSKIHDPTYRGRGKTPPHCPVAQTKVEHRCEVPREQVRFLSGPLEG